MTDINFQKDFAERMFGKTFEDFILDAQGSNSMGLPSFDEYRKNIGKYQKSETHDFDMIEKGFENKNMRDRLKRIGFEVFGVKCKSAEKAEQVMREHGFTPSQMKVCPELIPQNSYDFDAVMKFIPKEVQNG